ncbi:MAG: FAD-dependent oxidoreductase, partial [Hespellia sp.]|nr:FAD-dependent oxidoreductase [Hespellia sp.]
MRENMPEDMPLFMRHDAIDELMTKNIPTEEIIEFINLAADAGVDVADLSRGNACSFATVYEVPPFNLEPGFNMDNIRKIKEGVKIPVCGVGRLVDPADANKFIEDGSVDMVAVGRAQLADPEWCNKAQAGEVQKIRRCIGCAQGCYDAIIDAKRPTITCTRNPVLCKEYKEIEKAETPKNIMVVGGGMAGLQTAEFLKERGHNPIVFEAGDQLGGQFHYAGVAPSKQEMDAAATWEGEEAKRLGVEIVMNTVVTPELIAEKKPDEVVIAIGSAYKAPEIEGLDGENVYTQYQVLSGEAVPTGKVIVVGCGAVGSEVALHLASKGAEVVCLEKKFSGNGLGMLRKMFMNNDFDNAGIKAVSKANVYKIEGNTVYYKLTSKKTKKILDKEREFDSIVICTGIKARPSEELQAKCEELGIACHLVGDAKKATNALNAAADAYAVGTTI